MHPLSGVPDFHPKGNWYYPANPRDFTDSTVLYCWFSFKCMLTSPD